MRSPTPERCRHLSFLDSSLTATPTAFQILAKLTPTLTESLTPAMPAPMWLAYLRATVAPQMLVAVAAQSLTLMVTAPQIAMIVAHYFLAIQPAVAAPPTFAAPIRLKIGRQMI